MTRINTAALAKQATTLADRGAFVAQDPAVIKAAKEASADIAQAVRSTANLVGETRSSWHRSADPRR